MSKLKVKFKLRRQCKMRLT